MKVRGWRWKWRKTCFFFFFFWSVAVGELGECHSPSPPPPRNLSGRADGFTITCSAILGVWAFVGFCFSDFITWLKRCCIGASVLHFLNFVDRSALGINILSFVKTVRFGRIWQKQNSSVSNFRCKITFLEIFECKIQTIPNFRGYMQFTLLKK